MHSKGLARALRLRASETQTFAVSEVVPENVAGEQQKSAGVKDGKQLLKGG